MDRKSTMPTPESSIFEVRRVGLSGSESSETAMSELLLAAERQEMGRSIFRLQKKKKKKKKKRGLSAAMFQ
jgi:hypothetical protein